MKKRRLAILTVCLLAGVMSTTVFAQEKETVTEINESGSKASKDVTAIYSGDTPSIYLVDIEWGAMAYIYEEKGANTWNPQTHAYELKSDAAWRVAQTDGDKVIVTNHSNRKVGVAFSYTKDAAFPAIAGDFELKTDTLDAGVEGQAEKADKAVTTLSLSGALDSSHTTQIKVGSATVTLSAVSE